MSFSAWLSILYDKRIGIFQDNFIFTILTFTCSME